MDNMRELNIDELEGIAGGINWADSPFSVFYDSKDKIIMELRQKYESGITDWKTAADSIMGSLNIQPGEAQLFAMLAKEIYIFISNGTQYF